MKKTHITLTFFVLFSLVVLSLLLYLSFSIPDKFFDFSAESVCAAYIQGFFNVLAGTFALMAAVVAYRAATDDKEARRLAYCAYMESVIQHLVKAVSDIPNTSGWYSLPRTTYFVIFNPLSPEKWEDHSLLGKRTIEAIRALYPKLLDWNIWGENERYREFKSSEPEPLDISISGELTEKILENLKEISKELDYQRYLKNRFNFRF
ncbi:MAG: hypothetical protein KGQ54_00210 [Verrucomicrobia bacterium]|nr:hypothetical protein [Verrucomicrobiota bacterium]